MKASFTLKPPELANWDKLSLPNKFPRTILSRTLLKTLRISLESGNEKRNCSHGQKKDSRSFLCAAGMLD
jgi:hypothetical protein